MLPEWQPPSADVMLVFPTKAHLSAKTRALVDYFTAAFKPHREAGKDGAW